MTVDYTNHYMIDYDNAVELILASCRYAGDEQIETPNAAGRILAADILASEDVPPFANTAMDGYAVCASDLEGASADKPVSLQLAGLTAAGDVSHTTHQTAEGTAWKIMTGAPVPAGYDAIIPVENTQLEGNRVYCFSEAKPGAHIRQAGEDFKKNQCYLEQGQYINPNRLMALATLGKAQVSVVKKPTVAVLATGKELVDDLTQPLAPGQIRNTNRPYMLNWLSQLPLKVIDGGTNHDDAEQFKHDLAALLDRDTDIILSSGAVSMGDFDFIPQTIKALGGEIIFHKSKIRPGKPILFARFANGSLYFGLPGNPISAAVGLRFFVTPAITKMLGLEKERPIKARLDNAFSKKLGLKMFAKGQLRLDVSGQCIASVLPGQESFKINPLIAANGWVALDANKAQFNADDSVNYYLSCPHWLSELTGVQHVSKA